MTEHSDFLEDIVADDPANRLLAAELRTWRDGQSTHVAANDRLEARFSAEPAIKQPARWRSWMQRPAVAFAASFAAVLILGIGAFALVARDSVDDTVAAPTSIAAIAAADETPGEITLPSDLSEQTGYATCVLNELGTWFKSGFDVGETPSITATCGALPVPDLGPEADVYRQDLQAFANCLTGELDALLPELPALMQSGHDGFSDLENKCGEPPDPRDYGLTLPFGDLENLDLSQFNFGDLNLEGLDFSDFDLDEFLSNLPEGVLPEDFDLDELRTKLGDLDFKNFDFKNFNFDIESCDPADLPDIGSIEDLEDFDFETFFSEFEDGHLCGFGFFGFEGFDFGDFNLKGLDFGNFDLEGLDLKGLNIEELLADLETQFGDFDLEGLDLEGFDLEGLDLQELFDSLLNNGDFDFESLFGDGEFDFSSLFEDFSAKANA
ncbi:MAG: hypothetical protein GY720_17770 [bacterium]|nr:hypothetical protein [bacterium]